MPPRFHNAITDVPGIQVGHAQDFEAVTGCTVVLCEKGAVGGVDQRGGAPGTRETDLLRPVHPVHEADAILLTGGGARGRDAAAAVRGSHGVLGEKGAVGGVDQRGGAPGTRDTDLLRPMHLVQEANAILLTGGSAFGLDAAAGVMSYLEERKAGVNVGVTHVPIVPA